MEIWLKFWGKLNFWNYLALKKTINIAKRLRIFHFLVCFSVFVYKISIKIIWTHLRSIMNYLDSKISPSQFFGCCPANSSNWMGLENGFYMKRNYRKIFTGFYVGFNRFKNRIVKVSWGFYRFSMNRLIYRCLGEVKEQHI